MKNMLVGRRSQLGPRLRGRALRQPGLRSRLLPLVRRALGHSLAGARGRRCARSRTGSSRGYAAAAGDARSPATHADADRAHWLPDARADGRQVAGRVPGRAAARRGSRRRPRRCSRLPEAGLVAVDLIERVLAWEALDSRGTPTVACAVGWRAARRARPSSRRARRPARTRRTSCRDGGERYGGRASATPSRRSAPRSRRSFAGRDAVDQERDRRPPSRARRHAEPRAARRERGPRRVGCVRARRGGRSSGRAAVARLAPHVPPLLPLPMVNVISGGAHAGGSSTSRTSWSSRSARGRSPRRSSGPRAFALRRQPSSASVATTSRSSRTRAASRRRCLRTARRSRSARRDRAERARARRPRPRSPSTSPRRSSSSTATYRSRARIAASRATSSLTKSPPGSTTTRSSRSRTRSAKTTRRAGGSRRARSRDVQLLGDDLFVTSAERLAAGIARRDRERGAREAEPGRDPQRRTPGRRPSRGLRATRPSSRRAPARPRTAGSPTWRSAGVPASSRSARRPAPSAPPNGTGCFESNPSTRRRPTPDTALFSAEGNDGFVRTPSGVQLRPLIEAWSHNHYGGNPWDDWRANQLSA